MKTDDIDKIIAEALEEHKGKRKGGSKQGRSMDAAKLMKIRNVLNTLMIIGFVLAVIVYFAFPEQRVLYYSFGFGAIVVKIVEFGIRFLF